MNAFENYWKKFLTINSKGEEIYDGKKFEKLTKSLLAILYGKKWKETGTTHDGSKDFYLRRNNELLWAECKNYKDTIALNILAPTLVMAQVCDANVILFFSRSMINRFAKEKITTFGLKTSKSIIFYDADLLEQLILDCNDKLPKKWQLSSPIDIQNAKTDFRVSEKFFPSPFSCMVTDEDNYKSYNDATVLHYNEPFSLMLICCNNTMQNGNLEISFSKDDPDKKYFEYLNHNITADTVTIADEYMQLGESRAFLINLRVTTFRPFICLPRFTVRFKTPDEKIFEWTSNLKKVKCEWVGTTKLLGGHYNAIIDKIGEKLVGNSSFSSMLLSGGSGTGKSKLLHECNCPLLKYGYRILDLNVIQGHITNELLKEIIYFLYEIPAELITEVIKARINGMDVDQNDADANEIIQISKMIDAIEEKKLNVFIENYMEILFEKMSSEKIAIIIDNIQFAAADFQDFLIRYIKYSVNQHRENKSILIVSVNSDYMTEETAKTLYLLKNSNIQYFLDENVSGFTEVNQGILFLRELIHTDHDSYDDLFENIINSVSLNPFNLYQMVKLMEEDDVIKQRPESQGYIFSQKAMWKTTWKIPKDIDDTLERRLNFIKVHLDSEKLFYILSICFVLETIDQEKIDVFKIDIQNLYFLVDHQILISSELGYCFAHDLIRSFFERKYSNKRLLCLQNIEDDASIMQYSIIYNLVQICIKKNDNYIVALCNKKNFDNIPARTKPLFIETLFKSVIINRKAFSDDNKWVAALSWLCNSARNLMGSAKALEFHKKTYDYIENEIGNFSSVCSTTLRQLLHSHCDIYIQMHQRDEAIAFAQKVLNALKDIPILKQNQTDEDYTAILDEYYALRAIMYNRIFCAYNNCYPDENIMRKRDKAIARSRKLIPFIQDSHKQNLIAYLNNSDEGYRYYGLFSQHHALMDIWEKCLIDIPKLAPEKTMNYYRKCVQYYLIQQSEDETKKYIKIGRDYLEDGEYSHEPLIFNTFFTMAEAMCCLQHNPQEKYNYVEKLLNELVRIQLLLKSDKMGDIFLLRGVNAYYQNDKDTVYWALKDAYCEYKGKKTTNYWIKQKLIAENVVTAYSRLGITQSDYDISFLPEPYTVPCPISQQDNFSAQGIIRTKDLLFNLPLVV